MIAILSGMALGALHGARHAIEPDHVAAVTTLVADGPGARRGALLGAAWGLGHAVTLCVMTAAAAVAGGELPAGVEPWFELAVGVLLVTLGVRTALRGVAAAGARRVGPVGVAPRGVAASLAIGMVHGLAGSGALTALAAAEMPTRAGQLAFVVVFGAGSILGMAAFTGVLGAPLARFAQRPVAARGLSVGAGVAAITFGLLLAAPAVQALA